MPDLVIDTHIAVWALTEPHMLSVNAKAALVAAEANGIIYVSSMTLIELVYLTEKGKVAPDVLTLLRDALDDLTTAYRLYEIDRTVADTVALIPRTIVPEMPDRIIAATALYLNLPLVTADHKIQASNVQTIWK
jgi:PIN domain nuclease of toxin-antitoxin system